MIWFLLLFTNAVLAHEAATPVFRAGAVAVDVTPTQPTSIIAGGFLEARANSINDRLFVRAIVLDDGSTQIALAVVDTCMMTQALIDKAKGLAASACGIPVDRIMVSATHTHSAPAAMGCLGTRPDEPYAAELPIKIADAIVAAHAKRQPARIGWSSVDDWQHTHNRRWIRKPESLIVDPFGNATGRAHMHPGYLSRDVIGPSGPVDPALSVISLQTLDGQPLAVLANYSQHYFGAKPVSADYYGLFAKSLATALGQPGDGNGPFVCAMSQGTSGDLMWMDYGSPSKTIMASDYAAAVAAYAEKALASIQYHNHVPLAMVEKTLQVKYRTPDPKRLQWAQGVAKSIVDGLPKNLPEVYAQEAVILHERQQTSIKLQAIRIGDLTIATLPNEVYALTGLKLKARSPGAMHFNVELANGAEGYIPPPEQHTLGGYTTWPARTAGLAVDAEPQIVETLLVALEEATGKPRRTMADEHGPYAQAILAAKPAAYWRLNDEDGNQARNAVKQAPAAKLTGGFAWYLPGAGSGSGIGEEEHLTRSSFSGLKQINRAVHLASGQISVTLPKVERDFTINVWFWLGQPSGASDRSGTLCTLPDGQSVVVQQDKSHSFSLAFGRDITTGTPVPAGTQATKALGRADDWHMLSIVGQGNQLKCFLDGATEPVLHFTGASASAAPSTSGTTLTFGTNLQGKLDELSVFNRPLSTAELSELWQQSGMAIEHLRAANLRINAIVGVEPPAASKTPKFADTYSESIGALKPVLYESGRMVPQSWKATGAIEFTPQNYAHFRDGRLSTTLSALPENYSVSLWFESQLANDARPVTAYLFSRGALGDALAAGDHLGIGGTYQAGLTGKLMLFNGNARDQVLAGRSLIQPRTWNHVVLLREKERAKLFLNGNAQPEFDAEIEFTAANARELFFGARNDNFAPLQGHLAHFAWFDRLLSPAEAKQLFTAAGREVLADLSTTSSPTSNVPTDKKQASTIASTPAGPSSPPLSPEQSLAALRIAKGFRAELVVAEPLVLDPVAFDWGVDGRLWVVEMADYPSGMDGKGQAGGRIRVLKDVDGDGRYDESHLFAEGLNFPNGILTWRDGVIVTAAPHILFLRDSDGDGRAEAPEILFEGFQQGNQQLRLNGLRWGLDGWVYCANGGHHANYGVGTKVTSRRLGQSFEIGSRDFRFRPDSGELVLESGPSQYGRNRDAAGHWFGVQNAKPLWHYVIADRYLARNPHVPTTSPIQFVLPPGSPPVYPASQPEKRFHSFKEAGHFTSACSGMIYNDQWLFGRTSQLHAFTCEPFHNLIQHNVLSDQGVSFDARRPVGEGRYDFFASEDRWTRPVMVRTGPDGALWVADMYRYMIEHPDWLPPEGKQELLPHYRLGDDRGRIYRILPEDREAVHAWPFPDQAPATLLKALQSTNDWTRDKAQQLLLWSVDQATVTSILPELEQLVRHDERSTTRLQALHTLHTLHSRPAQQTTTTQSTQLHPSLVSIVKAALADPDARVREAALQLAEQSSDSGLIQTALRVDDPDAKFCLQLALSIGQWPDRAAGEALVLLARRFYTDPFMRTAIMSSALAHGELFARGIAASTAPVKEAFRDALIRQAIGAQDGTIVAQLLSDSLQSAQQGQLDALDGLLLTVQRLGTSLEKLKELDPDAGLAAQWSTFENVVQRLKATMEDTTAPTTKRIAAARTLARLASQRPLAVESLAQWLGPQVDLTLQQEAIAAMAQSADEAVPKYLAKAWNEMTPTLRSDAIGAWTSRATWTGDLLSRIERGQIQANSLDLAQRSLLTRYPDATLSALAKKLLADTGRADRQQALSKYREALTLTPDIKNGQAVYKRACASCHRRGDEGFEVGPNLATVVSHTKERLLTNILDPNADIQPGYHAYSCLMDSGEILSGLLAGETSTSLTIKQAGGVTRTVTRREIEKLQNSNLSFMPDGMEMSITQQEMADLLAFLGTPTASGN